MINYTSGLVRDYVTKVYESKLSGVMVLNPTVIETISLDYLANRIVTNNIELDKFNIFIDWALNHQCTNQIMTKDDFITNSNEISSEDPSHSDLWTKSDNHVMIYDYDGVLSHLDSPVDLFTGISDSYYINPIVVTGRPLNELYELDKLLALMAKGYPVYNQPTDSRTISSGSSYTRLGWLRGAKWKVDMIGLILKTSPIIRIYEDDPLVIAELLINYPMLAKSIYWISNPIDCKIIDRSLGSDSNKTEDTNSKTSNSDSNSSRYDYINVMSVADTDYDPDVFSSSVSHYLGKHNISGDTTNKLAEIGVDLNEVRIKILDPNGTKIPLSVKGIYDDIPSSVKTDILSVIKYVINTTIKLYNSPNVKDLVTYYYGPLNELRSRLIVMNGQFRLLGINT